MSAADWPSSEPPAVSVSLQQLLRVSRQTDGGDGGAQSSAGPEGGATLLLPVGVSVKQQLAARICDLGTSFTSVIQVFETDPWWPVAVKVVTSFW